MFSSLLFAKAVVSHLFLLNSCEEVCCSISNLVLMGVTISVYLGDLP
jgi:hypothetical protein